MDWLNSPDWALTSVVSREHLDRHPVQPRHPLQRAPEHPGGAVRGGLARRGGRLAVPPPDHLSRCCAWCRRSRCSSGLVYTLKVFDLIWIMTKGGPGDASSTLATWSCQLGFGTLLPKFGPGAAVGNILILIALVFGLLYIRVQRRQEA
ncbi:carbohydrate ABC transporter permease [Streptomyces sp. L7]